jgi:Holliday junction DNA helicase RuvA
MISFLRGRVVAKQANSLYLDVSGVGYQIFMPTSSLTELPEGDKEVVIHTHLHIKDGSMELYGFTRPKAKEVFENLISVSGIGPKVALAILSCFDEEALVRAIVGEDVELLTTVPGVGRKTARRLVLELKEKISLPEEKLDSQVPLGQQALYLEARSALLNLGYSLAETKVALADFEYRDNQLSVEEMVKHALKKLGAVR